MNPWTFFWPVVVGLICWRIWIDATRQPGLPTAKRMFAALLVAVALAVGLAAAASASDDAATSAIIRCYRCYYLFCCV